MVFLVLLVVGIYKCTRGCMYLYTLRSLLCESPNSSILPGHSFESNATVQRESR